MERINFFNSLYLSNFLVRWKVFVCAFFSLVISFSLNIQPVFAAGNLPVPVQSDGYIYVYHDFGFSGNNFPAKALIAGSGQEFLIKPLNDNCLTNPYSGNSCIECSMDVEGESWGGWLFTYGYIPKGSDKRELNFGKYPDSGYDLSKMQKLTFWAKGKNGGERVEFFVGGLGWNPETGKKVEKYPDSTPKISIGFIQLDKKWTEYTIDLDSADLKYISCGFGFVTSGIYNHDNVTFYLDDIKFKSFPPSPPTCNLYIWIPVIVAVIAGLFAIVNTLLNRNREEGRRKTGK